jgi:hypothetical protein
MGVVEMYITKHAKKRSLERTRLHPEDVRSIVQDGACVKLGEDDEYRYWLLFSPFDNDYKIAVSRSDSASLVTLWESDFALPERVRYPTLEDRSEARRLLQRWVRPNRPQSNLNDPDLEARVVLKVIVRRQERCTVRRTTKLADVWSKSLAFEFLREDFRSIYEALVEHYGNVLPIPNDIIVSVRIEVASKEMRSYRFSYHKIRSVNGSG